MLEEYKAKATDETKKYKEDYTNIIKDAQAENN